MSEAGLSIETVRKRLDEAREGWIVSHPWQPADYIILGLLSQVGPALCDEVERLRARVAELEEWIRCAEGITS